MCAALGIERLRRQRGTLVLYLVVARGTLATAWQRIANRVGARFVDILNDVGSEPFDGAEF